jgi:diguanylate cyclase (GGDEF)-like protein
MNAVAADAPVPATALLVAALATLRRVLDTVSASAPDRLAGQVAEAVATYADFDAVAVRIVPSGTGVPPSEGRAGRVAFPDGLLERLAWPVLRTPGATCTEPDLVHRADGWRGSLAGASHDADGKATAAIVVWCRRPNLLLPWQENLVGMAAGMLAMALRTGSPVEPVSLPAPVMGGFDPLTGLLDRAGFVQGLAGSTARALPPGHARYLLLADVDRFRLVRQCGDRLGAARLLRTLARLLQRHAATELLLGRTGPDQFGILIERGSPERALQSANALIHLVDGMRLSFDGQRFDVSISIGAIEVDERDPVRLIRLAEQACYAAKRHGGGIAEFYHQRLLGGRRWDSAGRLLNRVVTALKEDRLALFAQVVAPLGPVSTDSAAPQPSLYELLLRMPGDAGELMKAGGLIGLAERYGLSVKLDRWVIHTAFAAIARSRLARRDGCRFMLNLSGHSLDDACLLRFIVDEFTATGLSPSRICFEITETVAISDIAGAQRFVDGLRSLGCEFALDDFGSGHSSFLYLRDLAVDYVKIEGELVRAIVDDPVSLSLVRTIEGVGRLMGRKTIAEHVERPEILDAVREIGCDYAQGYWIGAPLPLARLLAGDEDPDGAG